MFDSYSVSTTGSNNLDGSEGNGLVCTGEGNATNGKRLVVRAYGVYAASALTTYALRLKDAGGRNMRTVDSGSSVVSDSALGTAIVVPPG